MRTQLLPDSIGLQIRVTAFTQAIKTIKLLGGNIARVNIMRDGKAIAHIHDVDNLTSDRLYNIYRTGLWLELEL